MPLTQKKPIFPSPIPTSNKMPWEETKTKLALDVPIRGGVSFSPMQPSHPLLSQSQCSHSHHKLLAHCNSRSFMSRDGHAIIGCGCNRGEDVRQSMGSDVAFTISTKFSAASASVAEEDEEDIYNKKNKIGRRNKSFIKIGEGFGSSFLKLPKIMANNSRQLLKNKKKKKSLSESQLRKKLKKFAERGDWDDVRKSISNYEFSQTIIPNANERRGSFQGPPASRRSSYRSRRSSGGDRRSFTGESVAAATAIKAALSEDSTSSENNDNGYLEDDENILHDMCRYQPPLDVVKVLLKALRHRRKNSTTSGIDDRGRTPLHIAAAMGASPMVIDALIRADPCPASTGDTDGRSPLHLAVRLLATNTSNGGIIGGYHRHHRRRQLSSASMMSYSSKSSSMTHNPQEQAMPCITPEEALEMTYQTILLLKGIMLTHPGKIDFKDEDSTGYSPLDYAIDGNITKEELIHALIRRKEPLTRPTSMARTTSRTLRRYNRRLTVQSSFSEDYQDIEILRNLEQDEIEARRCQIARIKARRQTRARKGVHHALFGVFGIDRLKTDKKVLIQGETQKSLSTSTNKVQADFQDDSTIKPSDEEASNEQHDHITREAERDRVVMADNDMYNQHLQDYLHDSMMDDLDGCDLGEYCDDDGFDILDDPDDPPRDVSGINVTTTLPLIIDPGDNDCASVVSEITVRSTL